MGKNRKKLNEPDVIADRFRDREGRRDMLYYDFVPERHSFTLHVVPSKLIFLLFFLSQLCCCFLLLLCVFTNVDVYILNLAKGEKVRRLLYSTREGERKKKKKRRREGKAKKDHHAFHDSSVCR